MTTARPLEPSVAAARGLSPAERARAVAHAKGVAFRMVNAVILRDAHMVQKISDGLSREDLAALVIVLAEVADPHRLKLLKDITDDGLPSHVGGERRTA